MDNPPVGGMDIFGCLPLYYQYVEDSNIILTLANLTFMDKKFLELQCQRARAKKFAPWVYEILPFGTKNEDDQEEEKEYFPEKRLAKHLHHCVCYCSI